MRTSYIRAIGDFFSVDNLIVVDKKLSLIDVSMSKEIGSFKEINKLCKQLESNRYYIMKDSFVNKEVRNYDDLYISEVYIFESIFNPNHLVQLTRDLHVKINPNQHIHGFF